MKHKTIKTKEEVEKNPEKQPELYIIHTSERQARSIIESLKQKDFKGKIAVMGSDEDFNRRALETLKINYLISPELGYRKDSLKQRDSGFNHVLAKIAKEKNISVVIDFGSINHIADKKQKALRLGRIIQNIKLCRKAGCKVKVWDLENKDVDTKALGAFGFSLGMSSQQVKESIN